MRFDELKIGDIASLTNVASDDKITSYAKISGDNNPIHLDEEVAKKSVFKKRIAQGLFISSFISSVIANKLPGNGSIYLNQNLNFLAPVFIGDEITASVEVTKLKPDKRIVFLKTICVNQAGDIVIEGTAVVKASR